MTVPSIWQRLFEASKWPCLAEPLHDVVGNVFDHCAPPLAGQLPQQSPCPVGLG